MVKRRTGNAQRKQPSFLSQQQEQIQARELAAVPHEPLKLNALDPVDLKVMSALLQDAIVPGTNFHYDLDKQSVTILAYRFCWEDSPERLNHKKVYGRILCCLQFQHVEKVQHIAIDLQAPENHYDLLSIENDTDGEILLTFAGTARLKLKVRELSCVLTDIDDMWYTTTQPDHKDSMSDVA